MWPAVCCKRATRFPEDHTCPSSQQKNISGLRVAPLQGASLGDHRRPGATPARRALPPAILYDAFGVSSRLLAALAAILCCGFAALGLFLKRDLDCLAVNSILSHINTALAH